MLSKGTSQAQATTTYIAQKNNPIESIPLKSTSVSNLVAMSYIEGDNLLLKGRSGIYIAVKTAVPSTSTTETFEFADCTDQDGNTYDAVEIGEQVWMAENLLNTKYNDGTSIPLVTSNSTWANRTTPAYCWYYNDQATAVSNRHGALYNCRI